MAYALVKQVVKKTLQISLLHDNFVHFQYNSSIFIAQTNDSKLHLIHSDTIYEQEEDEIFN